MTLSLENSVSALTSASNLSGEDSDEPPYFILQLLEFSNMMDAPHEGWGTEKRSEEKAPEFYRFFWHASEGEKALRAGGSEDCSKETITLIYPRDAQSTIFILYSPTRKAREPIEKGSAPLDGETPIGSIWK